MIKIKNCYDSHVHWKGTGEEALRLNLRSLSAPEDVHQLGVHEDFFRGEWLVGFGWDENKWQDHSKFCRQTLDEIWPNIPVVLSRIDGHAKWLNSEALRRAEILNDNTGMDSDIQGGRIERDENGYPTGVLVDAAMDLVHRAMPKSDDKLTKKALAVGAKVFNKAGFTHVREMSGGEAQWCLARQLENEGHLHLAVEHLIVASGLGDLDEKIRIAGDCRKDPSKLLRVTGIKVYMDGALGSEGAWLSEDYSTGSGRGLQLLLEQDFEEILRRCWQHDLSVAVHAIGDEAADCVVRAALKVTGEGHHGALEIEHSEMIRQETIEKMKQLNVTCHLQPCHWLSDKAWVEKKIPHLKQHLFPWAKLEEHRIPIFFGSDSPIEPPSLQRNLEALADAARSGIKNISANPPTLHSHPDSQWTPNTYSEFTNGQATKVVFCGQTIIDELVSP